MLAIFVGLFACLVYLFQSWIYEKYWDKGLRLTLGFSKDAAYRKEEVDLIEVVENRKKLPLPILTVKFETSRNLVAKDDKNSSVSDNYYRNDIFTMRSMRKVTRTIPFYCEQRGYYDIHDVTILAPNLFLKNEQVARVEKDVCIYVYPERIVDDYTNNILSRITGDVLSKRHRQEDVFEFRGIRDYAPTDEMRTINWKATARTGDLKVNMKNYTSLRAVRIFLNLEDTGILKHNEADEYAMALAASLCESILASGMRVILETNGVDVKNGQRISVPESGGRSQLDTILKSLARIDTNQPILPFVETLGQQVKDNTAGVYTILITAEVRDEFVNLVKDIVNLKSDFHVLQVYERQSEEKDVWGGITSNVKTVFIKD